MMREKSIHMEEKDDMKRKGWMIAVSMMVILGLSVSAFAAPSPNAKGQNKLEAPTDLTCTFIEDPEGDVVSVTWDLDDVPGYQVQGICGLDTIPPSESSLNLFLTSPVTLPIELGIADACVSFKVQVRALPGPKHEGRPIQSGGPKGDWAKCTVALPVVVLP
jgi:hypothetical protein